MTTQTKAMKLALEALKTCDVVDYQQDFDSKKVNKAITALREALMPGAGGAEQPAQQEPVAKYIGECGEGSLVQLYEDVKKGTNFYTSPPAQRTWVELTDEERQEIWEGCDPTHAGYVTALVEAKLKEKNA